MHTTSTPTTAARLTITVILSAMAMVMLPADPLEAQRRGGFGGGNAFQGFPAARPNLGAGRGAVAISRMPILAKGITNARAARNQSGKRPALAGTKPGLVIGDIRPPKNKPKPGHGDGRPRPGPKPDVVVKPRPRKPRPDGDNGDVKPPVIVEPRPRPKLPQIACDGGRVRGRVCLCPAGSITSGAGKAFACTPIVVVRPPQAVPPVPSVIVPPALVDRIGPPPAATASSPPDSTLPTITRAAAPPPAQAPPASPPSPPPAASPPPTTVAADSTQLPDEIVARIATAAPTTLEDEIATQYGLVVLEREQIDLIGARLVRFRIPDGRTVPAVIASLGADPRVGRAQPNYIYRRQQSDPAENIGEIQYALTRVNLGRRAHSLSTGRGSVIAVIDTPVDTSHPDLAASEVVLIDVTGASASAANTLPSNAHGTAIAGIIAADGVTRGIAPKARLLSVNVFTASPGTDQPTATSAALVKAVQRAATAGARIVNLSLAGPRDPIIEEIVTAAAQREVIMVAAAGNGGDKAPPAYPAAYPEVIAVTATDAADRLYEKANRGRYVMIAAPGVDVLVAAANQGHDMQSGTSFAAAHITGVIALLLEQAPTLTIAQVKGLLTSAATDLGKPGHDEEFGAGRIDAGAALALVAARSP